MRKAVVWNADRQCYEPADARPCPLCGGSGQLDGRKCWVCKGKGEVVMSTTGSGWYRGRKSRSEASKKYEE